MQYHVSMLTCLTNYQTFPAKLGKFVFPTLAHWWCSANPIVFLKVEVRPFPYYFTDSFVWRQVPGTKQDFEYWRIEGFVFILLFRISSKSLLPTFENPTTCIKIDAIDIYSVPEHIKKMCILWPDRRLKP